jgi:hypothetical protein
MAKKRKREQCAPDLPASCIHPKQNVQDQQHTIRGYLDYERTVNHKMQRCFTCSIHGNESLANECHCKIIELNVMSADPAERDEETEVFKETKHSVEQKCEAKEIR